MDTPSQELGKPQPGGVLPAVRKFTESYIAPKAAEWERNGAVPRRAFEDAANAGLKGVLVPKDLGGCGAWLQRGAGGA